MNETTLNERVAVLTAHRICHNLEHDGLNGKQAGCCIVCGVPWPCAYAGTPTPDPRIEAAKGMAEAIKLLNALTLSAQQLLARQIVPDSGMSDSYALGELFGIFDGPEQRAAQDAAQSALAAWEKLQ